MFLVSIRPIKKLYCAIFISIMTLLILTFSEIQKHFGATDQFSQEKQAALIFCSLGKINALAALIYIAFVECRIDPLMFINNYSTKPRTQLFLNIQGTI